MELSAEQKTLTDRIEFLESKAVAMQMNIDKITPSQRFLPHLYDRMKCLECGRTGKVICKIDRLSTIFDNARVFGSRKRVDKAVDENILVLFVALCSIQVHMVT